jgi:glycine/D-amino acid oxidase-like deaminating enzyme
MKLRAGYPFWLIKDGLPFSYPKLEENIKTDVVIIGGGISGALVRYYLVEAGIKCITVDARTVGLGSTCASTSLLQYEIDVPLVELIKISHKEKAERAYHLCNDAITKLGEIAAKLKFTDFTMRDSLYFAAYKKDVSFLQKEFDARKAAKFNVEFLNRAQIEKDYGISSPAAILSHHGAVTDAYKFVHELLRHRHTNKPDVFDRTKIVKRINHKNGVTLTTENGHSIQAVKVVYATGYEVTEMLDKPIVKLQSTYAIISEQFNHKPFWKNQAVLWNTADPYLYMRTTNDRRILIGGRDEDYYNPTRRDKLIERKAKLLANDFKKLFPEIVFNTEFSWAGTFGSTKDGLPYIGAYKPYPHSYFALGFGGNGITFSQVAAEIIVDLLQGKSNPNANLFAFDR